MRNIIALVVGGLLLAFMGWLAKEGFLAAKAYEESVKKSVKLMNPSTLAESQLKEFIKTITFGFVKNDIKQKLEKLKKEQAYLKAQATLYIEKYAIVATIFLLISFLGSWQVTTLLVSLGALLGLVSGLLTPILLIMVHKNVDYLGDIVLSFESKGILGSVEKLYNMGNYPVAFTILLFSVIIPSIKTLALLLLSIFEKQKFAQRIVNFFKHLGKWSMADVFVVSLLLVFLSTSSTDVSKAEIEIGLYFFMSYVIFSIIASITAEKMLKELN
jgi:hypothetical protein